MQTVIHRPTQMTTEAKNWLSSTVRRLREQLLRELSHELQSVYRLSLARPRAELSAERDANRARLERWLDEQVRAGTRGAKESDEQARERHLAAAIKLAGATLLNRLMVLRQMEALGLLRVQAVTGGWASPGYRELREFGPALAADADDGFGIMLRLLAEELSLDLPGLFGGVGINALLPIPAATLRSVVEALDGPDLAAEDRASLWGDDTLLGWVYQFWNDPERESLDEKIRTGGKIENHELAAKTQLFTDRYMVEWLLQNSLGQLWFGLCARYGWTPEVVRNGTLDRLEQRRVDWRERRKRGEVSLEALMPLESPEEERWKYWVPRDLPAEAASTAPASLRDMKLLDPACGSGHFLVIAFSLLTALYEEEARQRGESWSPVQIATWIVERNLYGLDIDPRAVQIAAAAVWLKMKVYAPEASPGQVNLVASNLGLGALPKNDPALTELEQAVERETGIPAALTRRTVEALQGADYLGSLLKVSDAVERALGEHERTVGFSRSLPVQQDLFRPAPPRQLELTLEEARTSLVELLERFVARHSHADDLGLRLRGEQLASGVRFIRMMKEGQYDLVVGNPPYQNSSKAADFDYVSKHYPEGRKDLYSAFLPRGLELARSGGYSGLLTLSGWMFLGQFEALRRSLLTSAHLILLGDFDRGAFEMDADKVVVSVSVAFLRRVRATDDRSCAVRPSDPQDKSYSVNRTYRKRAGLLCGFGRYDFHPEQLSVVPGHPLIYWWDQTFLRRYSATPKLHEVSPARFGATTGNDGRFLLRAWECKHGGYPTRRLSDPLPIDQSSFAPWIKGAQGKVWFEPVDHIVRWGRRALELYQFECVSSGLAMRNPTCYFQPGVAFSMIGTGFTARAHRYRSVFGNKGSSVFPDDIPQTLCLMNSATAREIMESLNPGIGFEVGDVNRLPLFPIEGADAIYARLDQAFTQHEQARETSVEFRRPGPSPWRTAQDWAQRAVDRPQGQPLPRYEPTLDPEPPIDHLSYALGVALGRFGPNGEGILDQAPDGALPHGILFLSSAAGAHDGLENPTTNPIHDAWKLHQSAIAPKTPDLRDYLRTRLFPDDHLKRYEKRPIYFPLSSQKRSFVAWCSIHRWNDNTLKVLLADHLQPELNRLKAELADLAEARTTGDRAAQAKAQARSNEVQALYEEMLAFVRLVQDVAERGAPPASPKCPPRDADAPFVMDLDDGVMINAAALWPLLEPQWKKDPAAWWTELCQGKGRKDYDWAHLSRRYFPDRVEQKCGKDPSLAVAHGCFWKYHPEKAYQWELRLQAPDELGPDFRLDEQESDAFRAGFEQDHPAKVRELREAEEKRRARKAEKTEEDALDFEDPDEDDDEDA